MDIFRDIIDVWKGKTFVDAVMSDFVKMSNETKTMYDKVITYIFKHKKIKGLDKKIYEDDIFVNKSERRIRKRLAEHLAVQHNIDVGITLIMMSIVKDAERIGDYCKNLLQIYDLLKNKNKFNTKHKFYNEIKDIAVRILPLIDNTLESFKKSDILLAKDVMDEAYEIGKKSESIIKEMANSKLNANDAVVLTLMVRFIKRISAHLSNISSSVIYPVHKIDFSPRNRKKNKKN